ncbi:glycoside hydrolase family 16 protein [uncultured Bacteroides sp.]|uniref:glycoside hydrolase family 16 protein n=1 Tax=uncultured Bacteroides sp. TaxID=162156 RepID=UPI002620FA67|nr:glycoside hydrolase family 16 protein [uncultured Bacteroides sp.]
MKRLILSLISILFISLHIFSVEPLLNIGTTAKAKSWKLIWSDEFNNKANIDSNWIAQNAPVKELLCGRWRKNAVIKNGKLYIQNKKENKEGQEWTSASLTSKKKFKYGYFECRLKIAKSTGINNTFWLNSYAKYPNNYFEIDIVEAHYPNWIQTNVHDWGNRKVKYHKSAGEKYISSENLSDKFHVYGLEWNEKELNFYLDGKLIRSKNNDICHDLASVIIGCAIMEWAGEISDSINGTSMIVDYVRVFNSVQDKFTSK